MDLFSASTSLPLDGISSQFEIDDPSPARRNIERERERRNIDLTVYRVASFFLYLCIFWFILYIWTIHLMLLFSLFATPLSFMAFYRYFLCFRHWNDDLTFMSDPRYYLKWYHMIGFLFYFPCWFWFFCTFFFVAVGSTTVASFLFFLSLFIMPFLGKKPRHVKNSFMAALEKTLKTLMWSSFFIPFSEKSVAEESSYPPKSTTRTEENAALFLFFVFGIATPAFGLFSHVYFSCSWYSIYQVQNFSQLDELLLVLSCLASSLFVLYTLLVFGYYIYYLFRKEQRVGFLELALARTNFNPTPKIRWPLYLEIMALLSIFFVDLFQFGLSFFNANFDLPYFSTTSDSSSSSSSLTISNPFSISSRDTAAMAEGLMIIVATVLSLSFTLSLQASKVFFFLPKPVVTFLRVFTLLGVIAAFTIVCYILLSQSPISICSPTVPVMVITPYGAPPFIKPLLPLFNNCSELVDLYTVYPTYQLIKLNEPTLVVNPIINSQITVTINDASNAVVTDMIINGEFHSGILEIDAPLLKTLTFNGNITVNTGYDVDGCDDCGRYRTPGIFLEKAPVLQQLSFFKGVSSFSANFTINNPTLSNLSFADLQISQFLNLNTPSLQTIDFTGQVGVNNIWLFTPNLRSIIFLQSNLVINNVFLMAGNGINISVPTEFSFRLYQPGSSDSLTTICNITCQIP